MHRIECSSYQELTTISFSSRVPRTIIPLICNYMPFSSIACFSATQKIIKKEINAFILKKWRDIGLSCFSQNLMNLSKEYFDELMKELGGIDSLCPCSTLDCLCERERFTYQPREISTIVFAHLANSVERFFLYEDSIDPAHELIVNDEILERIQSPLKRLHILENIKEKSTTKNIFVLITKSYKFFRSDPVNNEDFPLSAKKLFKVVETWKVKREECIDVEKENAKNWVLFGVSSVKDIDLGMLSILLQNGAFQKKSSYPSRFISHILNMSECGNFIDTKKILDKFHEYGICLDDDRNTREFETPLQTAGSHLLEKVLKLSLKDQGDEVLSSEIKEMLSQIQMSTKVIKYLIKKDVNINQEISIVKDGVIKHYLLLEIAEESLFYLKNLEKPPLEIIEDLKEIIRFCTCNVESPISIALDL